ncbi:MAG: aldose 1-epimerase family protein [Acidimicrobiales bacterium]|nr:aldose 1-epimerase family protein [Acidimicrobiales bacterium]
MVKDEPPPSGEQFPIDSGDQHAIVVEVGGGIREYAVKGRPVLDPYPLGAICDGAHGAPLVPWPNRLADGRYQFDGTDYQVGITEPDKYNAIHGLLRWRPWRAVLHEPSRVVMSTRIHPCPGFPFSVEITIEYRVGPGGLEVTTTARNFGKRRCPFGAGQHPYLSPGSGVVDDCVLRLGASTRVLTDRDRQLPVGREAVDGTPFDFRAGRRLGDLQIDDPFADLARDTDGRAWAELTGSDGATARLWVDERYPFVELYTGDTLSPSRRRRGLGCEPMTCPPNAFQSGDHLLVLEPAQAITVTWGARLD